jgi:hypothetical protein
MNMNVIHFDNAKRLQALVLDWRRSSCEDIRRRYVELCAEQRRGTTISNDVYEAWLQMSAYLTIAGMQA